MLLGDFVTDDSGSGIVHLAPDYGTDDFEVCKAVGIHPNEVDLLDKYGNFTSAASSFLSGLNIFSGASEAILEYLKCTGNFLSSSYYTHRYPYDWRTKKPVIQRATQQWFASISSILPQLENSLEKVQFIPENGKVIGVFLFLQLNMMIKSFWTLKSSSTLLIRFDKILQVQIFGGPINYQI